MSDTEILTVELEMSVKERLERLAKDTERSGSALAAEAIAEYLRVEEGQVAGIKAALASLDRGEGVTQDDVRAWVASWGTEDELPMPKAQYSLSGRPVVTGSVLDPPARVRAGSILERFQDSLNQKKISHAESL